MAQTIYIADDDEHILEMQQVFLANAGFTVNAFPTGDNLFAAFESQPCDLVILDVMMPGSDGLTICKKSREISTVPIIMLTAKESEMDYITGLALGGDDYLFKPFSPSMLVMRCKALLRRAGMVAEERAQKGDSLKWGDLETSMRTRRIVCGERDGTLTGTEFELLRVLIEENGQPVSRGDLLRRVWGIDAAVETRVTDETVRRLRKKLMAVGSRLAVKAVWGYGYCLEDPDENPAH